MPEREWGPVEQGTSRRYFRAIRDHWLLVALSVLVALGAGLAWWELSDRTYTAEAIIEITPVSGDDVVPTGVSVIRGLEPTRDVETIARFVTTPPVETRAKQILADEGVESKNDVEALPIAESFLLSVSASDSSPEAAAKTADAYARATVVERGVAFNSELTTAIERLEAVQSKTTDADVRADTAQQISRAQALLGNGDPSLQLLTAAQVPTSPSGPGLVLVLVAAGFLGLAVGIAAALATDAFMSEVRRDRQLTEGFRLPVLARVPKAKRSGSGVLTPESLGTDASEAYLSLRHNIEVLGRTTSGPRSILFTGTGPGEGKTTSAIATAASLAGSGQRVLLVDADLRRPSVAPALSLPPGPGLVAVLSGAADLEEAVIGTRRFGGQLDLLLAAPQTREGVELMTKSSIQRLIAAAAPRWDFVIFDSAPLGTVADALPIAAVADDVLVLVKRGQTRTNRLERLMELLERNRVGVRGFVFIGAPRDDARGEAASYYGLASSGQGSRESGPEGQVAGARADGRTSPNAGVSSSRSRANEALSAPDRPT